MKSSVNKGFMTYLLLFLGMLVGVVLVCCTIMMFSPGTEILGYVYYNSSAKTVIRTYNGLDTVTGSGSETVLKNGQNEVVQPSANPDEVAFSSLTKIIAKTNSMRVNFIHGEEDRIDVVTNYTGFNKAEAIEAMVVTKQYDSVTKTLTISAFNPDLLLALNNNCAINIYIKQAAPNLQAVAETTTSPITYATKAFSSTVSRDLSIFSLKATTTTGEVSIGEDGEIANLLEVSVEKANINISGTMGASEMAPLRKINLSALEGNIKFDTLYANVFELAGETTFVEANKVYLKDLTVANIEGTIVYGTFLKSLNIDIVRGYIDINEITGPVNATEATVSTSMKLGAVHGNFTLPANNDGNISMEDVKGEININSKSGNIEIKHLEKSAFIETTSGKITVLMEGNYNTLLTSTTGNVTVLYKNVLGNNVINTTSGKINVYYAEGLSFKMELTTSKKINLVTENLTFEGQEEPVIGYPAQSDEVFETTDVLNIQSESDITVKVEQNIAWNILG